MNDRMKKGSRATNVAKKATMAAARADKYTKQLRILELFGTGEFDPSYDYKAERRRKRSLNLSTNAV